METYSNHPGTTLSADISGTSRPVTFSVASAAGLPATGNFRVIIDSELLLITAISGTSLTGSNVEGTAAATHALGATVQHVLTAASLLALPVSGTTGVAPAGPNSVYPPPAVSAFTWVNQGGATTDESQGGILLSGPAVSGANLRVLAKSAPATPYTLTVGLYSRVPQANYAEFGIGWRNSSSGALIVAGLYWSSAFTVNVSKYSSATAWSAGYVNVSAVSAIAGVTWLRIVDNGVNRIVYQSSDGTWWSQVHSVGRTDFTTPDQVLIYSQSNNVSLPSAGWVVYWRVT